MKKIEVIIRPEKLDAVRNALDKVGYSGLMISEIEGHGKQKGIVQQWRGEQYRVELLPKTKIKLVVKNDIDTLVMYIEEGKKNVKDLITIDFLSAIFYVY